ncbi:MAG: metallophosphoesterase family protein [Planctomycetota bacterium]|jgi:diadenosine tetraphosphatase ApaH/serine/threonine PP2A family protein phosphatase
MKVALISDIHGNYDALKSVFAHIDSLEGIEGVYCLGDVVGYGPEPEECIDLVEERCELTLLGNHDFALLNAAVGFNPVAAGAISCIRKRMEPGIFSMPRKQARWTWLKDLPERHFLGDDMLVHASPRDNIFEYILADDPVYAPDKINAVFSMIKRNVFVGHTHRPGVITEEMKFLTPAQVNMEYEFSNHRKMIFNVSSVGQPRDLDSRACYAVISDEGIKWYRVEYDVESVISKIEATECLDPRCGTRLREGR